MEYKDIERKLDEIEQAITDLAVINHLSPQHQTHSSQLLLTEYQKIMRAELKKAINARIRLINKKMDGYK